MAKGTAVGRGKIVGHFLVSRRATTHDKEPRSWMQGRKFVVIAVVAVIGLSPKPLLSLMSLACLARQVSLPEGLVLPVTRDVGDDGDSGDSPAMSRGPVNLLHSRCL